MSNIDFQKPDFQESSFQESSFQEPSFQEPNFQEPNFQEPKLPLKIGKYSIEGLLTKGGMSLLYLGSHPESGEPILVKVLRPKFLKDPEMCERFLNEAKIIALADHPNIVKLYDYGRWEEGLYIAMEFVKGSSLRKILGYQPFSLKKALDIILQISHALCHLHSHGVIHGDLKPENVLVNEKGQVKVIDFGIARLLGKEENVPMRQIVGTPIYMSPEQHLSHLNVSFQSDIYALGIIAYELIMGRISHGRIIISLAPLGMQKILFRALQPNPNDRYSDIADFICDLSLYIKSGTFQKDKHGSDYFFELFENLEEIRNKLIAKNDPVWEKIQVKHIILGGLGLVGLYSDFLDLGAEKKAIFLAESKKKGAEGIFCASNIQKCLAIVLDENTFQTGQELINRLTHYIQEEFFYCLLLLDEKTRQIELFTNSYACLFDSKKEYFYLFAFEGIFEKKDELESLIKEIEPPENSHEADALVRKIHLKVGEFQPNSTFSVFLIRFL